jgi:hypothetical protein
VLDENEITDDIRILGAPDAIDYNGTTYLIVNTEEAL